MSHLNLKVLFGTKIQMVYLEKYLSFKYVKYEKKSPLWIWYFCVLQASSHFSLIESLVNLENAQTYSDIFSPSLNFLYVFNK